MNRRMVGLLIAVIVLLGGCSSGTGQPAEPASAVPQLDTPPAAQPEPAAVIPGPVPRIIQAVIRMGEKYPNGGSGFVLGERALEPGDSFVPSDDFVLDIRLSLTPDPAWYAAVRVEGPDVEPLHAEHFPNGWLWFRALDGQPGTTLTVTLPPVQGAAGLTVYRLTRVPPPTAHLEIQQGGIWQPVDPERIYPDPNLKLRFSFSAPMNRESVEESLHKPRLPMQEPARERLRFTWVDDQTLIAELDEAPALLIPSLTGSRDQRDLYLTGQMPNVYAGPAPYLAAVNPTSGAERRLREMMAEVTRASAAGDTVLVAAYSHVAGQNSGSPRYRPWLLNLKTGTIRLIDQEPWGLTLLPTGAVWSGKFPEELVKGYGPGPFSPDGSQRIFVRLPDSATGTPRFDEVGLELRTAEGKLLQVLPVRPRIRVLKLGPRQPDLAWSPDGTSISFTSDVGQTTDLFTFDLASGVSQKVATMPAYNRFGQSGDLAQWVGRRILAGRTVVDLDSGRVRTLDGPMSICFLSPDGRYLLVGRGHSHPGTWGAVSILSVDSGNEVDAGEGLPIGWSSDGEAVIYRWPNYPHNYPVQGHP